ncbi:MAG TPA: sulfotransferase [Saprospiraceae bacterium]|nr:sulfotransferase [Saprospiraceae bacterium]
MKDNLPNFLIVGAGKSGSTSLYHYINQHPDVFMPDNKEPNFLVADYQKKTNPMSQTYIDDKRRMVFEYDKYRELFKEANDSKLIGEATVTYLYKYDEAIPKIKKYLGTDVKIIIILREPVSRTFSNYAYAVELGYENLTFKEALEVEERRKKENWASIFMYRGQSEYYEQVKAYIQSFDNVLIILTEELKSNPKEVIQNVFNFLGLEDIDLDLNKIYNPSGIPRLKWLNHFLNQTNQLKSAIAKVISIFISRKKLQEMGRSWRNKNIKGKLTFDDNNTRDTLYTYYLPGILKLQNLINKDLSLWIKKYEK